MNEQRGSWLCWDCGVNTESEYYMVHDAVWRAGSEGVPEHPDGEWGGMLCIGCLEARLGRRLVPEDFTPASINHPNDPSKSLRLISRLIR